MESFRNGQGARSDLLGDVHFRLHGSDWLVRLSRRLPADVQRRCGREIGAWSISCVVAAAKPFRIACAQKRPATAIGVADHAIGFFRFRRLHPSANQWPKQFASLN
jgi:hypothetical protein